MKFVFQVVGFVLLFVGASRPLEGQQREGTTQFAAGLGPQLRATGADRERPLGVLGEVVVRRTHAPISPRFALGIAHFGSPFKYEGRLCNPDAPCDYYAPRITLLNGAVGAEWQPGANRMRGVFAISAYQITSSPVQGPSINDPGARRGVRRTGGIQAGIIVPYTSRAEIEVRYEWLAQSIESTRYFLPVVARFRW